MRRTYIPKNLNLEQLLTNNPPTFKYHIDYFHYIIGLITEIPSNSKGLLDREDFIPFYSPRLQSTVHDYRQYLDYLVENGVFETDNYYIPEEKSRGYRFTPEYESVVTPVIIEKFTLRRKIYRPYINSSSTRKYPYLYKWINSKLEIDYEKANECLLAIFHKDWADHKENALSKYNSNLANLDRFVDQDFFFYVDDTVGRLHTNLSNIKSELRNFITYDGQPLVSVDIKNSQPFLSTVLLDQQFYQTTTLNPDAYRFTYSSVTASEGTFKYSYSLYNNIDNKDINNICIMLEESGKSTDNTGFKAYKDEVINGHLYESMQAALAEVGIHIHDRKEMKEAMLLALFSDNKYIGKNKFVGEKRRKRNNNAQLKGAEGKQRFKELYPYPYEVFRILKRKESRTLPILLQRLEATLILDRVAKRIADERPKMPLFTIHDSVVCPIGNEEYVANVIGEETQKAIGVTPTLSFDYWRAN